MKFILFLSVMVLLSGCASREKVFSNKKTSARWVKVDNASEFMSEEELVFVGANGKSQKLR